MSKEQAQDFLTAIEKDASLNKKFQEYIDKEENLSEKNILEFAQTNGYEISDEDILECQKDFCELSDDQLEDVDAGFRSLAAYKRMGGSRSVAAVSGIAENIIDFIWRCKTGKWKAKGWCGRGTRR